MRLAATLILVATAVALATPAAAKTCKDPVTAKSTTRVAGTESAREGRATSNAIANWRDAARRAHGFVYRFWSRAEGRSTSCRSTPSQSTCTATARPCRLI
jgi:hypothetical protein